MTSIIKPLIETSPVEVTYVDNGVTTKAWELDVIVRGAGQGEEIGYMTELRLTFGHACEMSEAYVGHTHFDVAGMFCYGRVDNMDDMDDEPEQHDDDAAERRAVSMAEARA